MANTSLLNREEVDFEDLAQQFETASPQEILRWAADCYDERLIVVTSFQPTGIATLHMLHDIAPQTRIVTLDTGLLFKETYALMDEVEARFNLNLTRVVPQLSVQQQTETHGDNLWDRDPNQCCNIRKTVPLRQVLNGYSAWVTGLRRDQSPQRANTPVVGWDARYQMVKLCPFANWTENMVWTYIHAYELPYNELHDQGYPSIGCYHCTQPALNSDDLRSGRWVNHQKTECGIHFPLVDTDQNGS